MLKPASAQRRPGAPARQRAARRRMRGFSFIEVAVAFVLGAVLLALAAPAFTTWVRNAQVRAVTEALQNGARLAQAEAVRRHRQVVFFRTAGATCNAAVTASATGNFWAVRTVALVAGDAVETVRCGVLSDVAAGVALAGPTAICFNSAGRQVANANPGVGGAACALDASGTSTFNVSVGSSDRPLRVIVSLGGSVRMCDPARTYSTASPDGCPA